MVRAGAVNATTVVAMVLLDAARWAGDSRVRLTNGMLSKYGVDRFAKKRALVKLAKAGLIITEQSDGKSPTVKVLFVDRAGA
jgi:hypothetical protein